MKRVFILVFLAVGCLVSYGQSTHFENVFKACCMARSSMEHYDASIGVLKEATALLTSSEWTPLILQNEDVSGEADISSHLVFSPAFLKKLQENQNVFKRARKYAMEADALQRGGSVMLCTKCIGPESTVTYSLRGCLGKMYIGAVAEVNGLINLYVKVKDSKGRDKSYKVSSDEFKGANQRRLGIDMPEGFSSVYITLENKSPMAKSVALIIE